MRKYVILYRRGTGKWGRLTPDVHQGFYDQPAIVAAVDFLRANPNAEAVAVRLEDELFNVVVVTEPKTENTFDF